MHNHWTELAAKTIRIDKEFFTALFSTDTTIVFGNGSAIQVKKGIDQTAEIEDAFVSTNVGDVCLVFDKPVDVTIEDVTI